MPERVEGSFANPEKRPLAQLTFPTTGTDGVLRNVPALDKRWAVRSIFTNYVSLMGAGGHIKTGVELDEWHYEAVAFCEDMEFLLACRQHEFWSYMVYQKAALAAVVSFLQRSVPFYLEVRTSDRTPAEVFELYEKILNVVLRVICRLITSKESEEAWLSKEHIRELIYSNYLISVPMLFDLVVAVGDADPKNTDLLRKIFATVLKVEPQYRGDLMAALAFYRAAFTSIQTQAENEGFEGAGGGAPDECEETPYDDVALYTLDCAYTLSVLLEVSTEARLICSEIKLAQSIAHFYDSTVPFLYKNIFLVNEAASSLGWLNQARLQLLKAFRGIAYSHVEAVLDKPEDSLLPSENYIALMTECLSEQTFVVDYERHYTVEADVEILRQACKDLDDFKANFIVMGYRKEAEAEAQGTIGNMALVLLQAPGQQGKPHDQVKPENSTNAGATAAAVSASVKHASASVGVSSALKGRDIDLEVTAILDVLPHIGTGFARRLVMRYDTSEEAIAAILEENLPPDLAFIDHSEVYIPPDPQDKLFEETGVRHYNVYDGDQYDVMTQDKPNCIIKQGKGLPDAPKNAAEMLDDKRDLAQVRHRYESYALVAENAADSDDEYNDEYDDSYEALLESETRVVAKSKELKAGLANVEDVSDDEDESDDDNDGAPSGGAAETRGKRMDFCENPEVVRARYEARRQAKWGNRGGGGGGGGGAAPAGGNDVPRPKYDVTGAPKGQGQDKETLRNRSKKEAHKASRANHNRKAGAAFKRNKGMMA